MEKELWKGNEAVAEAAIRAGCKYFFGYPITPQNEIPEYLSLHLPQVGGCFIQAESEVAAINMVYGAAGCGVRAMPSCFREMPGEEEEVIARTPQPAAP